MTSQEIRQAFFDFFESKQHKIVPSAPMVVKDDPTLMFINAGMNQFKDYFLGNKKAEVKRVADSQKCLRVSGKHNDLEEVGHDTYHHTMFEMLGNWSFGDYFKKDAISWAWEFLVDVIGLDPERLYATVFEGAEEDQLDKDTEAEDYWKQFLPKERILDGSKKDNFWEMGETGPCGPCSEVHIDLRSDDERAKISGRELVNKDHPLVIEIWNLVFIQYNRKADGGLNALPDKHVDTGMGFERLCMAVQKKTSNYDTDVFQPLIQEIASLSGLTYGKDKDIDIAMRVIADHLRAVSFAIADGQLPSNNKAGYVIRRILRRAIRYAFTFLKQQEAFMYKLLAKLIEQMGPFFPELRKQQELITRVINEEELSFLKTLDTGITRLEQIMKRVKEAGYNEVNGKEAFELYDTYGFPFDLTELILKEQGMSVSKREFDEEMEKQKNRSRQAANLETGDWIVLLEDEKEEFVGYDQLETEVRISRYRKVKDKKRELFQLVFSLSPFYAESGGQVGDTGFIEANGKKTAIINTVKENDLIIHLAKELPENPEAVFKAVVSSSQRINTANNHTATHLLHFVLRRVLGDHVEQKGSLVDPKRLRFDFAHFQKLSKEEIAQVEKEVNELIRLNSPLNEFRNLPITEAREMGAMALFGEKYGDVVRVIRFGDSVELCGGTHAAATGQIVFFKIIAESAVAAGIRRIEAISGEEAFKRIQEQLHTIEKANELFRNQGKLVDNIQKLQEQNIELQRKIELFERERLSSLKKDLIQLMKDYGAIRFISAKVPSVSAQALKDLAFQLKNQVEKLFLVLAQAGDDGKAQLLVMISESLVESHNLDASKLIREWAKEIRGGGGGQKFFATAGGKNPDGIEAALSKAEAFVESLK